MSQNYSIKGLFQSMIPKEIELMRGMVLDAKPLKIQMTGDEKLIINERVAVVPKHLTDYEAEAEFVSEGVRSSGRLTVHHALKTGEQVLVLALNQGKLFLVIDRVG